jgi:hypothetical protein
MHPMKPDWRALALLAALFSAWAIVALAPGCDGRPRPAEVVPSRPDCGAYARSLAKAQAAEEVREGRMSLLEGAAAFRDADTLLDGEPLGDSEAYCREMIAWVRGPDAEGKVLPDLASLLEAELDVLRQEGLLQLPAR